MKQKITIEIENDTGVEFEEKAKWRLVRKGDFYVLLDEEGEGLAPNILKATVNGCFYAPVLTPKVDHELEEAKRLIGKWVKHKDADIARLVESVFRYNEGITFRSKNKDETYAHYELKAFAPFPLPVWRCCESDPPKETGDYVVRVKGNSLIKTNSTYYADNNVWSIVNGNLHGWSKWSKEWLDEGGE